MAFEAFPDYLGDRTAIGDYSSASNLYGPMQSTANTTVSRQLTAGGVVLGVLTNSPTSGAMAKIQCSGICKVAIRSGTHTAIAVMGKLKASTAKGFLPSTAGVGNYVFGRALETLAANTTGIISCLITHEGAGSSGNQAVG